MNFVENDLIIIIPELRVFARSRCFIQSDADDLVQKTLLRMLEKNHLFNGGKLIAWGITIMKNIIVDDARSTSGRSFVDIDDQPTALVHNDNESNFDDMNRALQQLNKKCREVLVLFGFGHSYDEISTSLGIEKGTVMSRLSRCRQQLVKVMN